VEKEKQILSDIKKFLKLMEASGRLTFTRIHCMPIIYGQGVSRKFIPNRDMVGFADLEVVAKGGIGYIEVKSESGRLTEAQKVFRDRVTPHGAKHCVARSIGDVVTFLVEEMSIDVKLL